MNTRSEDTLLPPKPAGLRKWLYDLPRSFYALHLGWLFGHRMLLLTHQGRKTGRLRCTVIEVIHYDRSTRESIVLAAYGKTSDWYRNLQAHPALEVQTGFRRYLPTQRFLTEDEIYTLMASFAQRMPRTARFVYRLAGYPAFDGSEAQLRALARVIGGVAFSPPDGGSPTHEPAPMRGTNEAQRLVLWRSNVLAWVVCASLAANKKVSERRKMITLDYAEVEQEVLMKLEQASRESYDPRVVAQTILRILQSHSPAPHYLVDKERWYLLLSRILPPKAIEFVISKPLGLDE